MTLIEKLRHEASCSEELDAQDSSVEVMRWSAARLERVEKMLTDWRDNWFLFEAESGNVVDVTGDNEIKNQMDAYFGDEPR